MDSALSNQQKLICHKTQTIKLRHYKMRRAWGGGGVAKVGQLISDIQKERVRQIDRQIDKQIESDRERKKDRQIYRVEERVRE